MSIFEDKKYKEMDWLEAVCQPIVDPLNEMLAELPSKLELTKRDLISQRAIRYMGPDDYVEKKFPRVKDLSWEDKRKLSNCFNFVAEGEVMYNSQTDEIYGGKIYLVKVKEFFDEKEVEKRIGAKTIETVRRISYRHIEVDPLNELLELFQLDEARRSRSKKQKVRALQTEIKDIFETNKWNIRDMGLSNRVGTWIQEYVTYGNLAALANICKLKAMIHNDEPIYSIEEEAL